MLTLSLIFCETSAIAGTGEAFKKSYIHYNVITSSKTVTNKKVQVHLKTELHWKFLSRHEKFIEILRQMKPVSSSVDRLDVGEDGTLLIYVTGDTEHVNIKDILQAVKKGLPQIAVKGIPSRKVKCLTRYFDELQKHIDVDFFLEHETNSVYIVFDENEYKDIEKNVDEIVSLLQTHENCVFQIFETPACVGRMVQGEHFTDVLRTHEGTKVLVQTYGVMEKTIITAIVPHSAIPSPETVFEMMAKLLQYYQMELTDPKCASKESPMPATVAEKFLEMKYGKSGPVFWDVFPGSGKIVFCCLNNKPSQDEIRHAINTGVAVVKHYIGEGQYDYETFQQIEHELQDNLMLHFIVKNDDSAKSTEICVYCLKKNKGIIEKN